MHNRFNQKPHVASVATALLDERQVAELLGVPADTIAAWRRTGIGPRSVRLGQRTIYLEAEVQQWTASGGGERATGIPLSLPRRVADDAAPAVLIDDHAQQVGA